MHAFAPAEVVHAIDAADGRLVLAECDVDEVAIRTPRYYVTRL
jgi:hypothetical protein